MVTVGLAWKLKKKFLVVAFFVSTVNTLERIMSCSFEEFSCCLSNIFQCSRISDSYDDVILLQLPESSSFFLPYLNFVIPVRLR